jgi:hypothetical protein
MIDLPGKYCSRRLFEWTMAFAMFGFGLHILLVPGTFSSSRYSAVLLLLNVSQFAAACVVVAVVRIVALARNGNWPHWGPRIRAMAAISAAVIWLQLAVALGQGTPSPGMWVYVALTGAEIVSVIRARRDGHGFG